MTPTELWDTKFFQKHLLGAIEFVHREVQDEIACAASKTLAEVQSPLEAAFWTWWLALERSGDITDLVLKSQVEVTAKGQSYRLDFQVVPTYAGMFKQLTNHSQHPLIAIELDGHDFHERTKEQVALRNQRDRVLTSDGWTVWHFSGSELNADPHGVVFGKAYCPAHCLFSQTMRQVSLWKTSA